MLSARIFAATLAASVTFAPAAFAGETMVPMVDGICETAEYADAQSHPVDEGAELFVKQDDHYVWLCFKMPPGSVGVIDARLEAPKLAEPLNLHISAQLGQWAADRPEEAPQTGTSEKWWNNVGWTANVARFNGSEIENGEIKRNFRRDEGREFQLKKSVFGQGPWGLQFEVWNMAGADGEFRTFTFPEDSLLKIAIH